MDACCMASWSERWHYSAIAAPPSAWPGWNFAAPTKQAPPLDSPSERHRHGAKGVVTGCGIGAPPREVAPSVCDDLATASQEEVEPNSTSAEQDRAQQDPQQDSKHPESDGLSAFTRAGRPACLSAALASKRRVWPQSRGGLPTRVRDLRVHVPRSDPGVAPHEAQQLLQGGFWRASAPPARHGALHPWEQALGWWMQRLQREAEAAIQRLRTGSQQLGALVTCCLPARQALPTGHALARGGAHTMRASSLGQPSVTAQPLAAPPPLVVAPERVDHDSGGQDATQQRTHVAREDAAVQPPLECPGGGDDALRGGPVPAAADALVSAAPELRAPLHAAMSWPGQGLVAPRAAHHRTSSTLAAQQVWGQVADQVSSHLSWSEPVSGGGGGGSGAGGGSKQCTDGRPAREGHDGVVGEGVRSDAHFWRLAAGSPKIKQRPSTPAAPALLPVDSASDMQKQQQQQQEHILDAGPRGRLVDEQVVVA